MEYILIKIQAMLESGEFNHSESGENANFGQKKKANTSYEFQ